MAFRFWRRVKIAPGVTLNLSKSGASVSVGPRGAKITVGPSGARASVGIPGTGLFVTERLGGGSRPKRGPRSEQAAAASSETLDPGFFARLLIPAEEEAFIDGCRELAAGRELAALSELEAASDLADAAFLAGCLALKHGALEAAERCLGLAAARVSELGRTLRRYGIGAAVALPITEELEVRIAPDPVGLSLARVELYQLSGRPEQAIPLLEELLRSMPGDAVLTVSLAELLLDSRGEDPEAARRVVRLTEGLANLSPVHAGALLYRARALNALGLFEAARSVCTEALRRRRGRSEDLLLALWYERARAYEGLGSEARRRRDLERIYASDSSYRDVAERLGVES